MRRLVRTARCDAHRDARPDPPVRGGDQKIRDVGDPRRSRRAGMPSADGHLAPMTDREAKSRAVKILAKSIYRDLEAQGFDEKQIVALATELISEVTSKISTARDSAPRLRA
jgi:hypothetical protein